MDIGKFLTDLFSLFLLLFKEQNGYNHLSKFFSLNPSVKSALDIIYHFQFIEKFENVNIFLSDSKQIGSFYHLNLKNKFRIENIKILKDNLLILTNKSQTMLNKYEMSDQIQIFFLPDNLNVLKCDVTTLYQILNEYEALHSIYTADKRKWTRKLIWIPENVHLLDENLLIKLNRLCTSFEVYVLNLKIDLDQITKKILFHESIKDLRESGTLSLKMYQSAVNCLSEPNLKKKNSDLNFMLKHDRVFLTNSQLVTSEHGSVINIKNSKRSYRIVSSRVEPFVVISKLDESLSSKEKCKDGMPCLDIDTNFNFNLISNNINEKIMSSIEKEKFIGLIKNFKLIPDKEINLNSTFVKTKCCTGYMINLLQKLSDDLNFEFELYFVNDINSEKKEVKWTNAIDHVVNQVAHIIAGPFSITKDRSEKIDFSVPFLYTSYSMLIKQEKKGVDDLWMFLRPFTYLHWVVIGLFGLLSAISLALLEFNSPFGLNPNGRQRARNYTLGSAVSVFFSLSKFK